MLAQVDGGTLVIDHVAELSPRVQSKLLHVIEEYATGFAQRWPELLGQRPWANGFFIGFNLSWIAIWLLCAFGIRRGVRVAFFPVWFFAIGMTVNLVGHPALALWTGGYFPGLWTSPIVGVLGVLLLARLLAITRTN